MSKTLAETEYEEKYEEYKKKVYDTSLLKNPREYKKIYKEFKKLEQIIHFKKKIDEGKRQLQDNEELLKNEKDKSMIKLIQEEINSLNASIEKNKNQLKLVILGDSHDDINSLIMEIRAGTGGDEASLFANDLFRLYSKFCDRKKWKIEVLSLSASGVKGIKEVIFNVKGSKVYGHLQYETGVHRVQRIPQTESSGRIHTSAVSVAVLKEPEKGDVEILDKDLKIDTYRASGAGGQHVNTTDSAIRLTHIPTGIVVTCQDERSQIKNKDKAFKVLLARLYERQEKEKREQFAKERKDQVGSGDRSEKVRTYNFPQGRISEHRTKLNLYDLEGFMNGEIDEVIDALRSHFEKQKLMQSNIVV